MRTALVLILGCGLSWGQRAASRPVASIEGQVVDARSERPVKRVEVVLNGAGDAKLRVGVLTDPDGQFSFRDVAPGRYTLTAMREGFLPASSVVVAGVRRPLNLVLERGQRLTGLRVKMHEAGLVTGRVKFEDGEAATGVTMQLYRERFDRGRHWYEGVLRALTNDRGEYRAAGLTPGSYYVAAYYVSPMAAAGVAEQVQVDSGGQPLPREEYVTTFYPSAQRLTDAVAVTLGYGQEFSGVDVVLTRARVFHIAGMATNGLTGDRYKAPKIALWRPDGSNEAGIPVMMQVVPKPDAGFEIRGLATGSYLLLAEGSHGGVPLRTRRVITLTSGPVDNLELLLAPDQAVSGTVKIEGTTDVKPGGMVVTFGARSEAEQDWKSVVQRDGGFGARLPADELYDVDVTNVPAGLYLQSVRAGGSDVLASGVRSGAGPIEVVLRTTNSTLSGTVKDNGQGVSGATVQLIPEEAGGVAAVARYASAMTDQDGNYLFAGVAPGSYVGVAWLDEPPCEVHNARAREACQRVGTALTIAEGQVARADLVLR